MITAFVPLRRAFVRCIGRAIRPNSPPRTSSQGELHKPNFDSEFSAISWTRRRTSSCSSAEERKAYAEQMVPAGVWTDSHAIAPLATTARGPSRDQNLGLPGRHADLGAACAANALPEKVSTARGRLAQDPQ